MIEYKTIVEGEVTQQTIEGQSNIYPNEIDPTVPKHVKNITEEDIKKWNQAGITEVTANDVKFEDGTTFQEKYDSGELKGEQGEQGIQGVPGKDGIDGKDGYTPIKGKDYFDGKNGTNGTNGISATHSWNGTTLTITSASGTSSANLKGEPGTNGTNGKDGKDGADGKTPIKGVDYFTTADKQELVDLVLAEIPSAEGVGY